MARMVGVKIRSPGSGRVGGPSRQLRGLDKESAAYARCTQIAGPVVFGAFDPGVSHGIAILFENGTAFVYGGRMKGKGKEEQLSRATFRRWDFVPSWWVEKPVAPSIRRKGQDVRPSRTSGISLGMTAGCFIGSVNPLQDGSRATFEFPAAASWNYRGRGMEHARTLWEFMLAGNMIDEHALAYEGTGRFKDVLAALGMLLVRCWREGKKIRRIRG